MTAYVALLRAVNVGGAGVLAMSDLAALCREAGFAQVRTYIASGNVVLHSALAEPQVRAALEAALLAHTGRRTGVIVRTGEEMAAVAAANPFPDLAASKVAALFVDAPLPADPIADARGLDGEQVRPGVRMLYVGYPRGMGASRLRLPAAAHGTARNMNTVAKLAAMAAAPA